MHDLVAQGNDQISREGWIQWLQSVKSKQGGAAFAFMVRYLRQGIFLCKAEEAIAESDAQEDWASAKARLSPEELFRQLQDELDRVSSIDTAIAELAVLEQVNSQIQWVKKFG